MTERIGGFELIAPIGSGSSAEVWQARDSEGRTVALKILHPTLVNSSEDCERLLHEAELAQKLDHANIMKVLSTGEHDGRPFLVLEYLQGDTLASHLNEGLSLRQGLVLLAQVADGLAAAHNIGLIHRDLKPENIFITTKGEAKITDWGIAKSHEASKNLTKTGMILGTPQYISPEQIIGSKLDGRCDLYALGVMIFELCADRLPFIRRSMMQLVQAHLKEPPPKLNHLAPNLPAPLYQLVEVLLRKEPKERQSSAEEVGKKLRDLASIIPGGIFGGRGTPVSSIEEKAAQSKPLQRSLKLISILSILFFLFVLWQQRGTKNTLQLKGASLLQLQRLALHFCGQSRGKLRAFVSFDGKQNDGNIEFDLARTTELAEGKFEAVTQLPFIPTQPFTLLFNGALEGFSFYVDPKKHYLNCLSRLEKIENTKRDVLLAKVLEGKMNEVIGESGLSKEQFVGLGKWLQRVLPKDTLHTNAIVGRLSNLRLLETAAGLAGRTLPWRSVEDSLDTHIERYPKFLAAPVIEGWKKLAHLQLAHIVGMNSANKPVSKSFWMGTKGFVRARANSHYARTLVVNFWAIDLREKLVPYSTYKSIERFELNIEKTHLDDVHRARFSFDVLHVDQRTVVKLRINGSPLLLPLNPVHFGRLPTHTDKRAWYVSIGISPKILCPGKNTVIVELEDFPSRTSDLGFGLRAMDFWYQ